MNTGVSNPSPTYMSGLRAVARHPDRCHRDVTRQGESQPCDKPAVAVRVDEEGDRYPVCKHHTAGELVPLSTLFATPVDESLIVTAVTAAMRGHYERGRDGGLRRGYVAHCNCGEDYPAEDRAGHVAAKVAAAVALGQPETAGVEVDAPPRKFGTYKAKPQRSTKTLDPQGDML